MKYKGLIVVAVVALVAVAVALRVPFARKLIFGNGAPTSAA
jgi:hypothetical protein